MRWIHPGRLVFLKVAVVLFLIGCNDDNGQWQMQPRLLGDSIAVNTHFGAGAPVDRAVLAKLRAAGVRLLRNDLRWEAVEQRPGQYDFESTLYDDFVTAASAAGLEILFILDYGNRLYGPPQAVVDDTGREAFAAFARAAASRYRGRGVAWEIWNEPNLPMFWGGSGIRPDVREYGRLVAATVTAIRAVDPTVPIAIGAAYTGFPDLVRFIGGVPGVEFLSELLTADAPANATALTFHPYRAEPPETVEATVSALRNAMTQSGRSFTLWCGEWGYSTYDPQAPATNVNTLPAVSLKRQASYVARVFLTNFRLGIEKTVWYQAIDPPNPDPGNMEDHFGLLHADGSEKPAYIALATLSRIAGTLPLHSEVPLGEGRYALRFGNRMPEVLALWSATPVRWVLNLGSGARVLDTFGQELASDPGDTELNVEPDDGPLYVTGNVSIVEAR